MTTKKKVGATKQGAEKKRGKTRSAARADLAEVRANLGAIQSLRDFRAATGALTMFDREVIIDQALVMIERVYVHLPLKRAMHAIDPAQRLRLLRLRLAALSEREFHDEMISVYTHLRDLHTNYILPDPYRQRVAFLPFQIEEYFDDAGVRQYLVTRVALLVTDTQFKPGVIPTHWNGVPIDRLVELNAEREAGSNQAARHAQGLAALTNRWMGMSLPPDEEWVVLRYRDGAVEREIRLDWQVTMPNTPTVAIDPLSATGADAAGLGIDIKAEIQRRVRKFVFSAEAMRAERQMAEVAAAALGSFGKLVEAVGKAAAAFGADKTVGAGFTLAGGVFGALADAVRLAAETAADTDATHRAAAQADADLNTRSLLPDIFPRFQAVTSPAGKRYGYIRLVTFSVGDVGVFLQEFIRIAGLLPQGGLILDVRGNGGGIIAAGEMLLQLLTPGPIEPAAFSLISSPLTMQMCDQISSLNPWKDSIVQSVETAAAYSQGLPLTPPEMCNSIGQKYRGPVVLITDAQCYSTTDMFAAGFQDHGIGPILGTAANTGAGGANVVTHDFLRTNFGGPDSPFKIVPGNASFRVAFRRSVRSGSRNGVPLEDLGVTPDEPIYRMSKEDLLNGNVKLIRRAAEILDTLPGFTLDAEITAGTGGAPPQVTVSTGNLDRLDVLVNGRPRLSLDVTDGPHTFTLPTSGAALLLDLRGFRDQKLCASARMPLAPSPPRPAGSTPSSASAAPSSSIEALLQVQPDNRDLDWLKEGLREAIKLEFSTIPPYLCGMWSVKDDTDPVVDIIYQVVLQEMLHMGLMCNLLAGLKELPPINSKAFVPEYPSPLPGNVHPGLIVSLVGLSRDTVEKVWMQIEQPENPLPVGGLMGQSFATIGLFYDALLQCFQTVQPTLDPAWQRTESMIGVFKITDLNGVATAIKLIKEQGEGTSQSAFDAEGELAHYYRFQQIVAQKTIITSENGKPKWDKELKFPATWNMAEVPKGGWQDIEVSRPFNRRFTEMLGLMQEAWSTEEVVGKKKLTAAIKAMRDLTKLARELITKKITPQGNDYYGPSFLYDPAP